MCHPLIRVGVCMGTFGHAPTARCPSAPLALQAGGVVATHQQRARRCGSRRGRESKSPAVGWRAGRGLSSVGWRRAATARMDLGTIGGRGLMASMARWPTQAELPRPHGIHKRGASTLASLGKPVRPTHALEPAGNRWEIARPRTLGSGIFGGPPVGPSADQCP